MDIRVSCICPPIPVRSFDWVAVDDDTYDGADDSSSPVGYGRTPLDAIVDLLDQLEERAH